MHAVTSHCVNVFRCRLPAWVAISNFAAMPAIAAVAEEVGAPTLPAPVGSGDLLNVTVSLFVVIAAIMLCGWLYKRSQGLRGPGGDVFSIVASQPLGPKERIVVIQVADKQLVLGMTATQVSTLHVFDEPVVQRKDELRNGQNFGDRFKASLRGAAK